VRLAFISDVHANLEALKAVLDDIPTVDRTICCGDLVDYYDRPNEVCALVRERGISCIRGNHDAYAIGALHPKDANRDAYRTDWTREVLEPGHLGWLQALGTELHIEADGKRVDVRHASPWDEETYVRPDLPGSLDRIEIDATATLVLGHTHRPVHLAVSQGWLLNPGSVGQPRDWDPRSCYAIFDTDTGAVEHRRVEYDVSSMQQRLERMHWHPAMVSILSRTR
jgi:predicted phosphodiesterase